MRYIHGFPRIGEKRELKFALENYWSGQIDKDELLKVAKDLRKRHLNYQKDKIDLISINDFSLYDNMIDAIELLGVIPKEYQDLEGLERYFAMARGDKDHKALAMTKWLNTNYHYFVPLIEPDQSFAPNIIKIKEELQEAKELGITPKINLIGPITFLSFSRGTKGNDPLERIEACVEAYEEILEQIRAVDENVAIQFDEPAFVKDPTPKMLELLKSSYERLSQKGLDLFVATYFEHATEAAKILLQTPIKGISLDFVHGEKNRELIPLFQKSDKILVAGIVDGRNIWISDIDKKVEFLESLEIEKDRVYVASSCSFLHLPYTLKYEEKLDSNIKSWLAFALEKLDEISIIDKLFHQKELNEKEKELYNKNKEANASRKISLQIHNEAVQKRLSNLTKTSREMDASQRLKLQHEVLNYPTLPTTTIGSFPQTKEVRKVRSDYKKGLLSKEEYEAKIKEFIDYAIKIQEDVGLDIFVHGEFERNDMVEYFGQFLEGVTFSENGWVQSYGSRCVKPPIIFGDISRPEPMTVEWITYAQSKTQKIVKGMLTGPVTMLNWSFVRDDLEREKVYKQMALAIMDEVADLQEAGIKIIQIDEAAFKEGYPLRKENVKEYERVAVESFKISCSVAKPQTQIHTHMCYSDFNDIMEAIDAMDADVISIETARNGNRILEAFKRYSYQKEVGVGVYDIHSPRIPSAEEIQKEIEDRLKVLPASKLWINPDCGLKTRKWEEVIPALTNMVKATKEVRKRLIKL